MVEDYKFWEKTAAEFLKDFEDAKGKHMEWYSASIQVKTAFDLCNSINALGENFVKQSNSLKDYIGNLRESIDDGLVKS